MKLFWGLAFPAFSSVASATAAGSIYLYDATPKTSPDAPSSVTPETARLILAQRLGLAQFHSIQHASERDIQQINAFGGQQEKLFGSEDPDRTQAHVLVWVEDVEDAEAVIRDSSSWSSSFTISKPPPASDNQRLVEALIAQAESMPQKPDPKGNTHTASTAVDSLLSQLKAANVYNEYLTVFRTDKTDDLKASELATTLDILHKTTAKEHGFSITLVLMPPSTSHSKRDTGAYGAFDLPVAHGPRRQVTEAPLTSSTAKPATSDPLSDLESFPSIAQVKSNDTTPVRGIIQSCFLSQSECSKKTNNCTGHGECKLLHKGRNGRSDCFACACKPEVKHLEDDGKEPKIKTTYWGGPACQKKDVSVPFWLFVGSGVLLAFLISSGIGMLYSMGSEELPSVIGAGVSGPSRK